MLPRTLRPEKRLRFILGGPTGDEQAAVCDSDIQAVEKRAGRAHNIRMVTSHELPQHGNAARRATPDRMQDESRASQYRAHELCSAPRHGGRQCGTTRRHAVLDGQAGDWWDAPCERRPVQYMSLASQPSTSTWTVVCVMWKRCSMSCTTARSTCWPSRMLCSATTMWQLQATTPGPTIQTCRSWTSSTPRDVLDRGDDGRHVHPGRRAFEQHGRALAQHAVAAVENQPGDQQRHDRIGQRRAASSRRGRPRSRRRTPTRRRRACGGRRCGRSGRPSRPGAATGRSARFTTIAAAATPIITAPLAISGARILAIASQPMSDRDHHQRDARWPAPRTCRRGGSQTSSPGATACWRSKRVPAEAERRGVRQVVARVGQQREAVGQPAGDRFDDDERQRQRDGRAHRPARHVRRHVRVAMGVPMVVAGVVLGTTARIAERLGLPTSAAAAVVRVRGRAGPAQWRSRRPRTLTRRTPSRGAIGSATPCTGARTSQVLVRSTFRKRAGRCWGEHARRGARLEPMARRDISGLLRRALRQRRLRWRLLSVCSEHCFRMRRSAARRLLMQIKVTAEAIFLLPEVVFRNKSSSCSGTSLAMAIALYVTRGSSKIRFGS